MTNPCWPIEEITETVYTSRPYAASLAHRTCYTYWRSWSSSENARKWSQVHPNEWMHVSDLLWDHLHRSIRSLTTAEGSIVCRIIRSAKEGLAEPRSQKTKQ